MAELSLGLGGGSSSQTSNPDSQQQASSSSSSSTAKTRQSYIRAANGDLVGNNFVVPKGDFAAVMGIKPASAEELSGKTPVSGARVIEIAMEKDIQAIGEGAAKNGNAYRNMGVASGSHANEPGREGDLVRDGLDAVREGPDKFSAEKEFGKLGSLSVNQYMGMLNKYSQQSKNDNMRYLEMQYKFMNMSKQQDTISNLMKVRNDAVTRTVRGGSG